MVFRVMLLIARQNLWLDETGGFSQGPLGTVQGPCGFSQGPSGIARQNLWLDETVRWFFLGTVRDRLGTVWFFLGTVRDR